MGPGTDKPDAARPVLTITGQVLGPDGMPAESAHVAVIGQPTTPSRGGDLDREGEVLEQAQIDRQGRFQLQLADVSSKTHIYVNLIARMDGSAVAWQLINLDAETFEASLQLEPEEPIRGQLVTIEGSTISRHRRTSAVRPDINLGTPTRTGRFHVLRGRNGR
jgi:hypothetical protein